MFLQMELIHVFVCIFICIYVHLPAELIGGIAGEGESGG